MLELDDAAKIYEVLGNRVRQTRTARAITLEQLAHLTGFTTSYLSKIENRRKVPPIATLARIARALEVDIAYFFDGERSPSNQSVSVVRAGERQPVIRGGTSFGYDYEGLAHTNRNKHMEPFIFTFPKSISGDVWFEHEGEEFVFVLSGRVEFEAGNRAWMLQAGDSLYMDSSIPHRGRSIGDEARALVIIFQPDPESKSGPTPAQRAMPHARRR
jgi:transcriptional regulator with XRE-family HTH domain